MVKTRAQRDRDVDNQKLGAYQALLIALETEREVINQYGAFSTQALDAEKHTRRMVRRYNLWRKK